MLPGAVVPIAETTRSGVVESIHFGAVVALSADGMPAWTAGDPDSDVYPRSALKPLQAQAMFDAGFAAEPDELAVAAASHSGEPIHLEVVRRILAKAGLDEEALGNTPALPLAPAVAADVLRAGGRPSALLQNCSGKHAAMLSTSVANGWEIDGYLEFEHPVQKLIDAYIADVAGGVSHTGVDGCGAPTAMVTLVGLAFAVRSLAIDQSPVYAAMRRGSATRRRHGARGHRADGLRAGTHRQGGRRGRPRRSAPRRPGGRRQGGRRFGASTDAGDAGRPPVDRVRRRRGAGAVDPRARPPGRRGARPRRSSSVSRGVGADPFELRRAALQERLHALLEVGAPEALDHQPLGVLAGIGEPTVQIEVHLALDHGDRRR